MKKILLSSVAAVALCNASAYAADMPVKAPPMAPAFSWTGCYGGIEGGGVWGKVRQVEDPILAGTNGLLQNAHASGAIIGGTLGCNYQTGNWVWGVEGDFSWDNYKRSPIALLPPFNAAVFDGAQTSWLGTARGRVGYAVNKSLWYVTGGAAFTDVKATEVFPGVLPSLTKDRAGWTVGAGVEWALADPRWSLKIEYLYADFGNKLYNWTGDVNRHVNINENIVRVGLNYRFGDWGKSPVVAKY